jgi:hypothetical protein
MTKENRSFVKPLLWAYSAVGAFTALSIAVPLLWERLANRSDKKADWQIHKQDRSR